MHTTRTGNARGKLLAEIVVLFVASSVTGGKRDLGDKGEV
jgi:hypothetical protein